MDKKRIVHEILSDHEDKLDVSIKHKRQLTNKIINSLVVEDGKLEAKLSNPDNSWKVDARIAKRMVRQGAREYKMLNEYIHFAFVIDWLDQQENE